MYRPLTILMWKHLMVRKRRYILTFFELILPIAAFVLIFIFKGKPKEEEAMRFQEYPQPIKLENTRGPRMILYTPETNFTARLMDKVADDLGLIRLDSFPRIYLDEETAIYYGSNLKSSQQLINDMMGSEAIVIFQDFNLYQLNYVLKTNNNKSTKSNSNATGKDNPGDPLMRLQWALDKNFLEMAFGDPVNQTVLIQALPEPLTTVAVDFKTVVYLPMACVCGLFLSFVVLVIRLVEERLMGIQEMFKMAGVSATTQAVSHFLNVLPSGIVFSIVGTVLLKASDFPILPKTNPIMLSLMLILHFSSIMLVAFLFSFIPRRSHYQYLASITSFAYMLIFIPFQLVVLPKEYPHKVLMLLTGVAPHIPMVWFWRETIFLELKGTGLDFSTWTETDSKKSGSVLESYLMSIVQLLGYSVLIWYLSLVTPGPSGVSERPWNFCWKKKVEPEALNMTEETNEQARQNPQYFEKAPEGKEVGIRVHQVTKIFGVNRVLDNASFDVYDGEITILLGHNGAGKTTLMSIITGTLGATSGKVYVKGMDVSTQQHEVRKHLGVCPQTNLFISHFSIIEHVIFFSLLKGGNFKEARAKGMKLLKELGINNKADALSSQLSGGMQRRLQLACALAGDSSVLILDEPTSGLDVETRRDLWNLLLTLRENRTMLLTTHFMEEADALGDRVAALHMGVLQCHATPIHLKKHIGAGYNLTFNTAGPPNESGITEAVTSMVPDATLKQKTRSCLVYDVPAGNNRKFPEIFRMLESKKAELGIESMGIAMPTMEEVFLRLCSDQTTIVEDDGDLPEPTYTRLTGWALYAIQIRALLVRQLRFIWFSKYSFAILQVILPVLFIFTFSHLLNPKENSKAARENDVPLDFNVNDENHNQKVFYKVNDMPSLRAATAGYRRVKFVDTEGENITSAALRAMSKNNRTYGKYVAGIELDDNNAKVVYNPYSPHAGPAALNLLSNLLATRRSLVPGHVINATRRQGSPTDNNQGVDLPSLSTIYVGLIYLSAIINVVSLLCRERAYGTRHIMMMAGCPSWLFWLTRILFYTLLFFVILVVPIIIATAVFVPLETLNTPESLCSLSLIFVIASLAWLAFICFVSFFGSQTCVSITLTVLLVLGFVSSLIRNVYNLTDIEMSLLEYIPLTVVGLLLPSDALFAALDKASRKKRLTALYEACVQERLLQDESDIYTHCGIKIEPTSYFKLHKTSPGIEMIVMIGQFVLYTSLTILSERGVFGKFYERVRVSRTYKPPPLKYNNEIVNQETAYVNSVIKNPTQTNDALILQDVHKTYKNICKAIHSLKGINFSVKQGECFGLLGVNGAGKSTTFKVIVADQHPTRGQRYANGYTIDKDRGSYLRSLAYCPQFFGLDSFLTGRQNLTLLLTLRGLKAEDVVTEVDTWINVVGLDKYKDRVVEKYSGGCQRRMATAAALSCGSPMTLLDEPTSGVDVAARRRVWSAIRRGLRQKRAVVITSHSMDEMEALCDRISIMAAGEFCALGSPAALREAFAVGYAVTFKITGGDTAQQIVELKSYMTTKMDCTLKDEHKTMIRYHVNDPMPYSELFTKLEEVLAAHPGLIEDYTVTSTTLEEVFLSFGRDSESSAATQIPPTTASHGTTTGPPGTEQTSKTDRR